MKRKLRAIIDMKKDQVLFIGLGPADARGDRSITSMGKAYSPIDEACIVV